MRSVLPTHSPRDVAQTKRHTIALSESPCDFWKERCRLKGLFVLACMSVLRLDSDIGWVLLSPDVRNVEIHKGSILEGQQCEEFPHWERKPVSGFWVCVSWSTDGTFQTDFRAGEGRQSAICSSGSETRASSMEAAYSRGGKGGMGSRDQAEQPIATATALQCLACFMEPMHRVLQLVTTVQLALFRAISYVFRTLSYLASWSSFVHKQASTGSPPQAPTNTQRSALYRVERFMWTNSRYAVPL